MNANQIDGAWYNELGSIMNLEVNGNTITGTYQTAVGNANGIYQLTGLGDFDIHESETLGWVVSWNNQYGNSDSITTWSGQYQEQDGEEVILTTWLLTEETDPNADWHSTNVGMDAFYRYPLTKKKATEYNFKFHGKQPFPQGK